MKRLSLLFLLLLIFHFKSGEKVCFYNTRYFSGTVGWETVYYVIREGRIIAEIPQNVVSYIETKND